MSFKLEGFFVVLFSDVWRYCDVTFTCVAYCEISLLSCISAIKLAANLFNIL